MSEFKLEEAVPKKKDKLLAVYNEKIIKWIEELIFTVRDHYINNQNSFRTLFTIFSFFLVYTSVVDLFLIIRMFFISGVSYVTVKCVAKTYLVLVSFLQPKKMTESASPNSTTKKKSGKEWDQLGEPEPLQMDISINDSESKETVLTNDLADSINKLPREIANEIIKDLLTVATNWLGYFYLILLDFFLAFINSVTPGIIIFMPMLLCLIRFVIYMHFCKFLSASLREHYHNPELSEKTCITKEIGQRLAIKKSVRHIINLISLNKIICHGLFVKLNKDIMDEISLFYTAAVDSITNFFEKFLHNNPKAEILSKNTIFALTKAESLFYAGCDRLIKFYNSSAAAPDPKKAY